MDSDQTPKPKPNRATAESLRAWLGFVMQVFSAVVSVIRFLGGC
ncbi:hypothetical protein [Angustibacter aerolatus]|nr:hypothetical protein [Angustibacter aerolatus]